MNTYRLSLVAALLAATLSPRISAQHAAPTSIAPSLIQYSHATGVGYSTSRLILYNADKTFVEINSFNSSLSQGTQSQASFMGTFTYTVDPLDPTHATIVYAGGRITLANDELYFGSKNSGTQISESPPLGTAPGIEPPMFNWSPLQNSNGGVNISNRCQVNPSSVAISGFGVQSTGPRWVLLREIGATLKIFDVTGVVSSPSFTLYDSTQSVIGTSSVWSADPNLTQGYSTIFALAGAFSLSNGSDEAVLLVQLNPGTYTSVFTARSAGTILCEVYILPF